MFDPTRHPSRTGVLLVTGGGALMCASVWLLPDSAAHHLTVCGVAVAMILTALGLHAAIASRTDARLLVGYPLIIFIALAFLGHFATGLASSYAGLFTLAFIFIGLCAPPGTTPILIPPAVGCWLLCYGVLEGAPLRAMEVRLPVALCIWTCAGGLLSQHAQSTSRAEESLRLEARRDPLTGLHNRRALDDLLESAQDGDVVVMLDIDHFKSINDRHGHDAGDRLLEDFARTLLRSLRGTDTAIRYGGDEFLLYLPATPIDRIDVILERIHRSWNASTPLATFSAGVAPIEAGRDARSSVAEADQMLYQAKRSGRDQWAQNPIPVPKPRARQTDLESVRR